MAVQAHVEKIRALFSQLGAEKTGVITYAMHHGARESRERVWFLFVFNKKVRTQNTLEKS